MRKKTEGPKKRQTTPEKGATQKRVRSLKGPSVSTVSRTVKKATNKKVVAVSKPKIIRANKAVAKKARKVAPPPPIKKARKVAPSPPIKKARKVAPPPPIKKARKVAPPPEPPYTVKTASLLLSTLDVYRRKRRLKQKLTALDVIQSDVSARLAARARPPVKWEPGPIIRANKTPRITREFFEKKRKELQAKRNRKKAVKRSGGGLGQWTLEQQALIPESIKKILRSHKPRKKRSKSGKKEFLDGALMVTEKLGLGFKAQMTALKHLMNTELANWEDAVDIPVILHRLEMAMAARRFNACLDEISNEIGLSTSDIYTFWLYK